MDYLRRLILSNKQVFMLTFIATHSFGIWPLCPGKAGTEGPSFHSDQWETHEDLIELTKEKTIRDVNNWTTTNNWWDSLLLDWFLSIQQMDSSSPKKWSLHSCFQQTFLFNAIYRRRINYQGCGFTGSQTQDSLLPWKACSPLHYGTHFSHLFPHLFLKMFNISLQVALFQK